MSCSIDDENEENCSDFVNNSTINSSRLDSGYLTFTSPCDSSPCRLSPCSVVLITRLESPSSECDPASPVPAARRNFLSTVDYERYVSNRKYFDILTQLDKRNTLHLIDKILSNLSGNDLKSCATVNRKWFLILKDYHRRKKTKHVKRNLFQQAEQTTERKTKLTSTPMQTVTNLLDIKSNVSYASQTINNENVLGMNATPEKSVHLTTTTTTNVTCAYDYLKYFHGPTIMKRCPVCGNVSVIDVNDQHGFVSFFVDVVRFVQI